MRISLGILRSTHVINLRYETNIRSLDIQRDILITKLFYPLTYGENKPLIQIDNNIKYFKINSKVHSALYRIL